MTWRDIAARYPEFVQWIVQRHGGLPDGPVEQADYERYSAEWEQQREGVSCDRDGTAVDLG